MMLSLTFNIAPFLGNLIATLLTFIYVFGLITLLKWCVLKFNLPQDISRKIVHIGAGSTIGFLPLYNDLHWSKYLNVAVFVLWIFLLIQKGLFAAPEDEAVITMTRTGDRRELLKGPLFFVIVATICGTFFYKNFAGIVAMASLGWGDGIAPIIGSRIGRIKYTILSTKTLEGTLTMLIFAFIASMFFVWLIIPGQLNVIKIFLLALLATLIEGCSPKEIDNILIPIGVAIAANFI
jgi:phytol kinase